MGGTAALMGCIASFAGMDAARLLNRTRLTLIGNMSRLVIYAGTPEENCKEAARILEQTAVTGRKGYSCGTIIEEMPKENYDAVIQARLDFNKRMQAHKTKQPAPGLGAFSSDAEKNAPVMDRGV